MRSRLLYLLIGALVVAVFFFSWLPQPSITHYGIWPRWLSHWTDADENMNSRTAVPMVLLGVLSGLGLRQSRRSLREWCGTWLALAGVVALAEAGQLVLPHRHFDWGDVAWGAGGALAGMLTIGIATWIWKKARALV